MTYVEARLKSLTVKWKVDVCEPQGHQCWCRVIRCEEPLMYNESPDLEEELYVLGSGALDGVTVEHIVKIHNDSLNNKL